MSVTRVAPASANPSGLVTLLRIVPGASPQEKVVELVQIGEGVEHTMLLASGLWPEPPMDAAVKVAAEHGWGSIGRWQAAANRSYEIRLGEIA